jgi:hypothetical protein
MKYIHSYLNYLEVLIIKTEKVRNLQFQKNGEINNQAFYCMDPIKRKSLENLRDINEREGVDIFSNCEQLRGTIIEIKSNLNNFTAPLILEKLQPFEVKIVSYLNSHDFYVCLYPLCKSIVEQADLNLVAVVLS